MRRPQLVRLLAVFRPYNSTGAPSTDWDGKAADDLPAACMDFRRLIPADSALPGLNPAGEFGRLPRSRLTVATAGREPNRDTPLEATHTGRLDHQAGVHGCDREYKPLVIVVIVGHRPPT
jgi:hypothetical protein